VPHPSSAWAGTISPFLGTVGAPSKLCFGGNNPTSRKLRCPIQALSGREQSPRFSEPWVPRPSSAWAGTISTFLRTVGAPSKLCLGGNNPTSRKLRCPVQALPGREQSPRFSEPWVPHPSSALAGIIQLPGNYGAPSKLCLGGNNLHVSQNRGCPVQALLGRE